MYKNLSVPVLKKRCCVLLTVVGALILSLSSSLRGYEAPEPEFFHQYLSQSIVQILSYHHYSKKQLDDETSQTLYEEYFNSLDPRRRFFLQQDIEEFSQYRTQLDEHLPKGNLEFAFAVYERYVQRVEERVDYARERLGKPFDFTRQETVLVDRENCDWAETPEDLDEVWRKLLKNRVLSYKIMEEDAESGENGAEQDNSKADSENADTQEEERQSDKTVKTGKEEDDKGDNSDTAEAKSEEVVLNLEESPRDRVLHAQERFLDYLKENEPIDIIEMYLTSLANIFDPHSSYMTPAMEEDFNISMSLSLEGIGAVLKQEQGYATITKVVPGGPAAENGDLEPGDRIISVEDEEGETVDVINMPLEKIVRLIRGEKGTEVTLTVLKGDVGSSGVPTRISLTRDKVKFEEQRAKASLREPDYSAVTAGEGEDLEDVSADQEEEKENSSNRDRLMLSQQQGDEKIMVLKLESFYSDFEGRNNGDEDFSSASKDVKKLLQDAEDNEEVKGVILDLRSNGGGSLEEAIEITGFFLAGGPVVQVKSANGTEKVYDDPDDEMVYSGPVVVLVNKLSASASEIVAGAIKDYDRGIIMGSESTHGKGTVQMIMELDRIVNASPLINDRKSGSLRLSTAKYYRASGKSTQLKGVKSHIYIPTFTEKMDLGEDQLDHAMDWDEIDSLDLETAEYVSPYLDVIQARSSERLEVSPDFAELQAAVKRFADIQDRKEVTLSMKERRRQLKEEKQWLEKVRERALQERHELEEDGDGIEIRHEENGQEGVRSDSGSRGEGDNDAEEESDDVPESLERDLMVAEALRVASDLYWLSEKKVDPESS